MMNHWLFRCKDITELISQSMDTKLPLRIRLGIKFHLMICYLCRRYQKQLELIQKALGRFNEDPKPLMPEKPLPDNVKDNIKKQLK